MKITLSELRNLIKNVIKEEYEEKEKNSIYEEISQAIHNLQDVLKDYIIIVDKSESQMAENLRDHLNDFSIEIAKKSFQ